MLPCFFDVVVDFLPAEPCGDPDGGATNSSCLKPLILVPKMFDNYTTALLDSTESSSHNLRLSPDLHKLVADAGLFALHAYTHT